MRSCMHLSMRTHTRVCACVHRARTLKCRESAREREGERGSANERDRKTVVRKLKDSRKEVERARMRETEMM